LAKYAKINKNKEKKMSTDDKLNLNQDLEALKADLDKLSADVGQLMWKSTVGRVEYKISRRPFSSLLWAFGAGFASCVLFKLLSKNKDD
jgi:hypothetical protein